MSAGMAMPGWAYDPGTDHAPDREPLETAKRLVPLRFNRFVPADDPAFLYGLALHDGGFFWEAHEIWEAVWKACPPNVVAGAVWPTTWPLLFRPRAMDGPPASGRRMVLPPL